MSVFASSVACASLGGRELGIPITRWRRRHRRGRQGWGSVCGGLAVVREVPGVGHDQVGGVAARIGGDLLESRFEIGAEVYRDVLVGHDIPNVIEGVGFARPSVVMDEKRLLGPTLERIRDMVKLILDEFSKELT